MEGKVMMIAQIKVWGIEVHQYLNGFASIQWLRIASLPYSDSNLHTL
jgi:hypothetical protein